MNDHTPRILVGFDGSEESKRALRWAAELAVMLGAEVRAFHAWQFPAEFGYGYADDFEGWDPAFEPQREFNAVVDELDPDRRPIRMDLRVVRGDAAEVLITESAGALMLVVGNRGRGGFASLMMGSVSAKCARHSSCPVLVVRGKQELRSVSA